MERFEQRDRLVADDPASVRLVRGEVEHAARTKRLGAGTLYVELEHAGDYDTELLVRVTVGWELAAGFDRREDHLKLLTGRRPAARSLHQNATLFSVPVDEGLPGHASDSVGMCAATTFASSICCISSCS